MSKPSLKNPMTWLNALYGDHWSTKSVLIIVGFLIPLIFSIVLLFEVNSILSLFNFPFNPWIYYHSIISRVGLTVIMAVVILSVLLSLITFIVGEYLNKITTIKPLELIYKEVFIDKKTNQLGIFEKHITIQMIKYMKMVIVFFILSTANLILLIPSIIIGLLTYILFALYAIPQLSVIVKIIPFVGESFAQETQHFFNKLITVSQPYALNINGSIIVSVVLAVFIFGMFGFMNLIETNSKNQYRNPRNALFNGFKTTISNLNLPRKIAQTIYTTILCLFTDQKTISLNISVINSKNVEKAIRKVLSQNLVDEEPMIATLAMERQELKKIFKNMPKEYKTEIVKEAKSLKSSSRAFALGVGSKVNQNKKLTGMSMIWGLNSQGIKTYAIISKNSPSYQSRLIQFLWCSDPLIKEAIVDELHKLDSLNENN
jgi:hypothetical protein